MQAAILSVKSPMHLHHMIVGVGRLVLQPGLDPTCGDRGRGWGYSGDSPMGAGFGGDRWVGVAVVCVLCVAVWLS